jgi:NADH-quinone oxidoreductase subunit H
MFFLLNTTLSTLPYIIYTLLYSLVIIVCLLISIAYFTLVDRKVMAAMQRRSGPNTVGFWGMLQPLADGVKLLLKETVIPAHSNRFLFIFSPALSFVLSLLTWTLIPYTSYGSFVDIEVGVLIIFIVSSFGVYGIILAGWASNSKYAFLGALRASAQMISYEVSIGFILIAVLLCTGSTNLYQIATHQSNLVF